MKYEEYRDLVIKNTKEFEPDKAIKNITNWLAGYKTYANMDKAVLGISGGKDSTVVAAILKNVLGAENVIGLMMPNGVQTDIDDSKRVIDLLGIKSELINIDAMYKAFFNTDNIGKITLEASYNIPPRLRMTVLYVYGQSHGCRVAGTGNLSERYLGYFTKWGDGACDFNIIGNYTSFEVMRIGEELGLPIDLVYKTPADGLTGLSDEEKLGVSYADIHNFIRRSTNISKEIEEKIINLAKKAAHKNNNIPMPNFCNTNR